MTGQDEVRSTLGTYRLLDKIAEGGMGVVYLARGPGQRTVALKVLRPTVAGDPTARRRLAREVGTMQRVRSPHVAEVIDADLTGDVPYIVTRFVPGRTLDEVVSEGGPLRGSALAGLACGLAEALVAVHAAGVVHRDVKPGNVMLLRGSPVIIDFGIAQGPEATRLTLTGMFMGTPGYLSPEVIEGQPSSAASDVHAWGATVAFAATGRPPYGTGPYESVFYRIVNGQPDLAGAPAPLVPVLAAALARDPAHRPSAQQLSAQAAILDAGALDTAPAPAATDGTAGSVAGVTVNDAAHALPGLVAAPPGGAARAAPGLVAAAAEAPDAPAGMIAPAVPLSGSGPPEVTVSGPPGGNGAGPSPVAAGRNGAAAPPPGALPPTTRPLTVARLLPDDLADVLTPVRYEQHGDGAGPGVSGPADATSPPSVPGTPDGSTVPARSHRALVLVSMVLLASVGVIVPVVGTLAGLCVLLALRTTALAQRRSARRRESRGAKASDPFVTAITLPWYLLRAGLALLVLAPFALAAAAMAAGLTVVVAPADWPARAIAVGAGTLVAFYGLGPGSGPARRQLGRVFAVADTPMARWVVLTGVTALAVAAFAAAVSWPSLYWPASVPGGFIHIGIIHLGPVHRVDLMRGTGILHRISLLRHYVLQRLG